MGSWWRLARHSLWMLLVGCGGQSVSDDVSPSNHGSDGTNTGGSTGASTGGTNASVGSGATTPDDSWIVELGDEPIEQTYAVGSDAGNNVFVLRLRDIDVGLHEPTFEKYSPKGQLMNQVDLTGSFPTLLAVQANGNSVTAERGVDALGSLDRLVVRARDPSGNERWASVLEVDAPFALMALNIGSDGHTFLLWTEIQLAEANHNQVLELDEQGHLLYRARTADPGTVYASALDRSGNLLEAGGAGEHYARKHDSRGNALWTAPIEATPNQIYGDDQGNTLVVGLSAYGQGHLTKLDSGGNPLIASNFETDDEYVTLVAGDAFGRSYTVGTFPTELGAPSALQAWRFDVDGSVLGTWNFPTTGANTPAAAATDSTGALLIVGMTAGAFPGYTNPSGSDSFIMRIAPDAATGANP